MRGSLPNDRHADAQNSVTLAAYGDFFSGLYKIDHNPKHIGVSFQ
jgi:hypothetical protein